MELRQRKKLKLRSHCFNGTSIYTFLLYKKEKQEHIIFLKEKGKKNPEVTFAMSEEDEVSKGVKMESNTFCFTCRPPLK